MNDQLCDYKTNPDGVSGAYLDAQRLKAPDHRTYEQRILSVLEEIRDELRANRLPATPPVDQVQTPSKPHRIKR